VPVARGLAPHHTGIDATLVARAGERGLAVVAWTVNAPDDIRRMLALGVDAIISDHPARVVAARADAG
jgi:glycerophosphoryl diester phosphodiesterase